MALVPWRVTNTRDLCSTQGPHCTSHISRGTRGCQVKCTFPTTAGAAAKALQGLWQWLCPLPRDSRDTQVSPRHSTCKHSQGLHTAWLLQGPLQGILNRKWYYTENKSCPAMVGSPWHRLTDKLLHPWKCPGPGWSWDSGRWPFPWHWVSFKVSSNQNHTKD